MDITTEVGLTYLCQQIYTVLAKRSIVFSMNLRTCLGYTTRLNPISPRPPSRFSGFQHLTAPQTGRFQVFRFPVPRYPPNARHTNPSARNGSPSDGREVCRMQGRG